MKVEGWSMKDEGWRMKNKGGNRQTREQMDICDCRVAFLTEKLNYNTNNNDL